MLGIAKEPGMTGVHDLGGQPAGPIDLEEHEPTLFDMRVDAMIRLLTSGTS